MTSAEPTNNWSDLEATTYRVRSWGDFSVQDETGSELKLRGKKTKALLAFLVFHPDRAISRERLTGLLWGDRAEEQARASLRQVLVELRQFTGNRPPLIKSDRMSVAVNQAVVLTDIDEIARLAERGEFDVLLDTLPEPAEQFLANLDDVDASFDDWLKYERGNQREALARLIAGAANLSATRGQLAVAQSLVKRARQFDPLLELPHRQLEAGDPDNNHTPASAPFRREPLVRRWRLQFLLLIALSMIVVAGFGAYWGLERSRDNQISIAVLPFEDRSPEANPYLADGIAEEIMIQLQRIPGQRVVGRTSAWSLRDQSYDAPTIGKKLNASYLVEGSVQSQGQRVRINVSLVRTNDGSRLWTQRFDGRLNDMLALQDRVGAEISNRLRSRSVSSSAAKVRPEAYTLYLAAKGFIRTRERAKGEAAIELLRQALIIDPSFAPAWAALGRVKLYLHRRSMPDAAFNPRAPDSIIKDIRRALALQPNLAEAHLAMGVAAGPGPDRRRHLSRAAALNPNDAEIWDALALDYRFHGEYGLELDAWKRAVEIDPLWHRAFYNASEAAWNLQQKDDADRFARKASADAPPQPFTSHMVRADQTLRRADFSASLAAAEKALLTAPDGRQVYAQLARSRALRAMGDFAGAVNGWPYYPVDAVMKGMWRNQAPSADHVRRAIANPLAFRSDEARITFYLATLINAGRAPEAVRLFETRYGSPSGLASQQPFGHASFIRHATLGTIAYAKAGRMAEASQMTRLAAGAVSEVMGRGPQPIWYPALCAQLWSISGKRDAALAALERSERLGWFYGRERDSFGDLAIEPAFAAIVSEPRFQAIRKRLLRHAQKERAEVITGT